MNNNANRYLSVTRTIFQVLSYFSFLVAAASLNFPARYLNIFLFSWMILNGTDLLLRGKHRFELPNKNNIHLYFLLAFYLWMVISLLWTDNFHEGQKILMIRLSFLLFPVFAFLGFNKFYNFKQILLAFVSGSVLSVIAIVILGYSQYKASPEMYVNFTQFSEYIIAIYKHRTHYNTCLIFGIISYVYLRDFITEKTSSAFYYIIFFVLVALFFSVIYFSGSRMALIIFLVILSLIGIRFLLEKGFKKLVFLFLTVAVFSSVFLLANHSRMQHFELTREKLQQFDPRYELWRNTVQCLQKSNIILGEGIGDCEDVFVENHQKPEFQEYYFEASSPHNEFLKTQLELGIIGNLLLVAIFVPIVINAKNRNTRFFIISLTVTWFLFMLIETIGWTSTTTYMFGYSLLLVYWAKNEKEAKGDIKPIF